MLERHETFEPDISNDDVDDKIEARTGGAFCRFQNIIARDQRLDARALVWLAYRYTFADAQIAYGLNEATLLKSPIVKKGTGFGTNHIRKAIVAAKAAGYLTRSQSGRRPTGRFGFAVDDLVNVPCGQSGNAGRHLKRAWFDGTLTLKAMATWLYLRAGTGKGARTYAREIAERFDWSRPTVALVLAELEALGLIAPLVVRDDLGRISSTTYAPAEAADWRVWSGRSSVGVISSAARKTRPRRPRCRRWG
jgi:hypothetical protein